MNKLQEIGIKKTTKRFTTIGGTMGTSSYQQFDGTTNHYEYKNVQVQNRMFLDGTNDYLIIGLFDDTIQLSSDKFTFDVLEDLIESHRVTELAFIMAVDTKVAVNYMKLNKDSFIGMMKVYQDKGDSKAVAFAKSWSILDCPVDHNICKQITKVMIQYGYEFINYSEVYKLIK
jgi:hypothetical protein